MSVLPDAGALAGAAAAHLRRAARRRPPLRQPAARAGRATRRRGRADGTQLRRADHRDPGRAAGRHRRPAQRRRCRRQHLGELLRRSGARVLVTAGPELAPEALWRPLATLAATGAARRAPGGATHRGRPAHPSRCRSCPGSASPTSTREAQHHDSARFAGTLPRSSDLAALFHTGGTTGAPKLAAHTHAMEVADAWMLAAVRRVHAPTRRCSPRCRCSTSTRSSSRVLMPLFKGQQVVWAGPLGYRDPALVRAVLEAGGALPHRLDERGPHRLRRAEQTPGGRRHLQPALRPSSAPPRCPPRSGTSFQAHTGVTADEGYGLTEATCASARTFPGASRPGSVGQRLPYQRMKAVRVGADGTWEDLPAGQAGVLAISGPTVFPGYVVGRDEHGYVLDGLGKLGDGWLDTGDLARVDDDGFVHLSGRAKDLIIRGGHNIDPTPHRGRAAGAPAGRGGRGRRPARPARRGGPGRLRGPRTPGATVGEDELRRLGTRPRRRARRRAQGGHRARRAPGHRRGQARQAAAARGRHPTRRPRGDRRGEPAMRPSRPGSRTAPRSPLSPWRREATCPRSRPSSAATRSRGRSGRRGDHGAPAVPGRGEST